MIRNRTAAIALALFSLAALCAGCAGTREAAPVVGESGLPVWVKIVVPEVDGRTRFVGGVSFAEDVESGLEAATIDAQTQVHLHATRYFTDGFTMCVQKSGVETTAMERLEIKNAITNEYGERMVGLGRVDDRYHEPCAESLSADGPVCRVFVLMTVGADEWDTVLAELLAGHKRRYVEDGKGHLADFLEWMIRRALEEEAARGRER